MRIPQISGNFSWSIASYFFGFRLVKHIKIVYIPYLLPSTTIQFTFFRQGLPEEKDVEEQSIIGFLVVCW